MKKIILLAGVLAAIGVGSAFTAMAMTGSSTAEPPPRILPYQGYLEDVSSTTAGTRPVSEPRRMTFFITNEPGQEYHATCNGTEAAPGCRWSETQLVTFNTGYFSVQLGNEAQGGVRFPDNLFDTGTLFIRVRIDNNGVDDGVADVWTQLEGAQQLLATPYAITAQVANNFHVDGTLTAGQDVVAVGGIRAGGTEDIENGSIAATGNISAAGMVMADDVQASDLLVGRSLIATEGAWIGGTLWAATLSVSQTSNLFSRSQLFVAVNGAETVMGRSTDSICFLTRMSLWDNEGSDGREDCRVYISDANWKLDSSSHNTGGGTTGDDILCEAYCFYWK